MKAQISADEFLESFTGFDEIAVEKAFGKDVMTLGQEAPTTFLRALVFVHKRRDGLNDSDAKQAVLGMTLREVNNFFEDEEEEVMPDEPVTVAGKDASVSTEPQMTSLPSVS